MFTLIERIKPLQKMRHAREIQKMNILKEVKMRSLVALCAIGMIFFPLPLAFSKSIILEVNDAEVLNFDKDVAEIFIANPDIADVQLSSPHTAYVFGKTPGATKLFVMNGKGKEILKADIHVTYNLSQLKEMIAPFDPYGLVELRSIPGAIILEGQVDSPKTSEDIRSIAEKFLGKKDKGSELSVINRLSIKTPVQVNVRVKVAEVKRSVLNNLGINWQATIANAGLFNFGALTGRSPLTATPILGNNVTSLVAAPSILPNTNLNSLGFNVQNSHVDINAVIDMLSQDGLVTILAEPNLVAISGETASFLAGGEFPYPVPQQLGNITIEFKQYGISLAFTPTVMDGRLISMRVRPEVSELDPTTGISVNGISVPGILTRWAETTVELASGQTFAIAGLIQNQTASYINALPGLGDLPILGALFRSNQFQRGDTELVILVTPYLVEPASGKEMLAPTDNLNFATFVEQIFERRLVKEGVQKGKAPAFGPGGVRLIGPAGFSIE